MYDCERSPRADFGKVFFFHNPKAGGASLRAELAELFPPAQTCPIIENDPLQHRSARWGYESFKGYRLYLGHYGHDIYRAVGDGHLCLTNFRHPVSRLLSLYNYFRDSVHPTPEVLARPEYFAVRMAKSARFEDFALCDDARVAVYTADHHFRQLAESGWSMETSRSVGEVCRFIDSMPWFYVCEHPELSFVWARRALGWTLFQVRRENVTPPGHETSATLLRISDDAYERIVARNRRDLAIYRYAAARLLEQSARETSERYAIARSA